MDNLTACLPMYGVAQPTAAFLTASRKDHVILFVAVRCQQGGILMTSLGRQWRSYGVLYIVVWVN